MQENRLSIVAILDGYGAGRFFIEQLVKKGYQCIHIRSTPYSGKTFYNVKLSNQYIETFNFQGNLNQLISDITKRYDIISIIPGSEPGVTLAHRLSQVLNLKRNGDDFISARRNKYDMIEAVKNNNLATVTHYKTNNFNDAEKWVAKHNSWPVVLKPLDSGGSDHVYICHNKVQVKKAFDTIINSDTIYDNKCDAVLLQSYLAGEEYVVNLVSCNGIHFVAEVRKYHKQNLNGKHIYDYEELLPCYGLLQSQLSEYAKNVADAVGIKYGPSHIEIMLTKDGPILVEIAARISGATYVEVNNEALGYNVVDLTIDSYLDENNFMKSISNKFGIKKYENVIDIATEHSGYIQNLPSLEYMMKLPSVKNVKFNVKIGDYISPTVSLINSPAKIHLVHENAKQISLDRSIIKTIFIEQLICVSSVLN